MYRLIAVDNSEAYDDVEVLTERYAGLAEKTILWRGIRKKEEVPMATLPTPEENARKVLDIFRHSGTRPGEILLSPSLISVAVERGWRPGDIDDGLQYGLKHSWFEFEEKEQRPFMIFLTEDGFKEI